MILSFLPAEGSLALVPGIFHLTLVRNTGIAFGLFRGHATWLFGLITLSLVILFVVTCRGGVSPPCTGRGNRAPTLSRIALALILGGAVGNWIDRLRFGAVIDFLDFRVWPVFNAADSAITVGVGLYLLLLLKKNPKSESRNSKQA